MAIKMKSGNGWVPVPGTAGTFATPTQQHERVTLTEAATVIPIGLALREGDFLTVLRENLPLVEGENYTKGDGSITLAKAGEPGDTFDFFIMHYELAPTRGHVDDRGNPHGVTAAQLGDDALTEGSLLKLKGGKLSKAVEGVDFVFQDQVHILGDFLEGWKVYHDGADPAAVIKMGKLVHVSLKVVPPKATITRSTNLVMLPYRAAYTTYEVLLLGDGGEVNKLQIAKGCRNLDVYGGTFGSEWNTANFCYLTDE
ncbi:hypothetical protein F1904_12390 [Akkermansia muciniphila]|uniref:hypothetical protein n=1 Tax=Akkermansia muciniphila TaxID=239935 RepID=UPI00122EC142|nr:hypothetical protein F1904_12390 [Akkermansia muciniphila]